MPDGELGSIVATLEAFLVRIGARIEERHKAIEAEGGEPNKPPSPTQVYNYQRIFDLQALQGLLQQAIDKVNEYEAREPRPEAIAALDRVLSDEDIV